MTDSDIRESCASSANTIIVPNGRLTPSHSQEDFEKEIAREENAFAMYGGDDPHEPSPREDDAHTEVHHSEEKPDPWKVQWNGPDDQTNPQNWSKTYKWFLTALCCLLTVNVYATPVSRFLRATY